MGDWQISRIHRPASRFLKIERQGLRLSLPYALIGSMSHSPWLLETNAGPNTEDLCGLGSLLVRRLPSSCTQCVAYTVSIRLFFFRNFKLALDVAFVKFQCMTNTM